MKVAIRTFGLPFTIIGILVNLFGCMNSKPYYEYADGNANRYRLTPDSLHYIPVRPEQSSSGTYSGGEPKSVSISQDEFNLLENTINTVTQNTSLHSESRVKMSGMIFTGSTQKEVIIKPSPELQVLDSLFQRVVKK